MEKNSTRWLSMLVGGAIVGVLALTVLALTDGGPSSANGSDGRTQQTDPQTAVTKLRSVTVQGHGSVKATPDTVIVDIGVQTQALHANDALKAANTKMQVLLDTLKASGVSPDDITTTGVSLNPQYDSNGRLITGYQASNSVSVKIRNVANAGKVIDDVAGLVGDEFTISNVSFTVDDPSKYEDQARAEAIADAKARPDLHDRGRREGRRAVADQRGAGAAADPLHGAQRGGRLCCRCVVGALVAGHAGDQPRHDGRLRADELSLGARRHVRSHFKVAVVGINGSSRRPRESAPGHHAW